MPFSSKHLEFEELFIAQNPPDWEEWNKAHNLSISARHRSWLKGQWEKKGGREGEGGWRARRKGMRKRRKKQEVEGGCVKLRCIDFFMVGIYIYRYLKGQIKELAPEKCILSLICLCPPPLRPQNWNPAKMLCPQMPNVIMRQLGFSFRETHKFKLRLLDTVGPIGYP